MVWRPTLRDLFVDEHTEVRALAAAARAIGGAQWQFVYDRAVEALDIDLNDVLLAAWGKQADVQELLRSTAVDSTHSALVHLTQHVIESTHAPSIEVRSRGTTIARLSLTVAIVCYVESVEIVIRAGAIEQIHVGEMRIQGTVALDGSPILDRKLSPITPSVLESVA